MNGLIAFIKKEYLEQIRTYRMLIMISTFFLFGMMSPLLAKLMPEIISGMDMQGVIITVPPATVMDSYGQFFKNMNQMGLVVVLLVFGGILSNELIRGTLINMLSKGLGRHTVILAKYIAALTLWTVSYLLSCVVNQAYTAYLFDTTSVKNLIFSLFCQWMFGAFILALVFLSSTLTGGNFGGLILTAVFLGVLLILNVFPEMKEFNPVYLSSHNVELLAGSLSPNDVMLPLWITVVLTVGSIWTSIALFAKKKL